MFASKSISFTLQKNDLSMSDLQSALLINLYTWLVKSYCTNLSSLTVNNFEGPEDQQQIDESAILSKLLQMYSTNAFVGH